VDPELHSIFAIDDEIGSEVFVYRVEGCVVVFFDILYVMRLKVKMKTRSAEV